MPVQPIPVPGDSLLAALQAERAGFADAYALRLPRRVGLADFLEAFYTSALFRKERWLLARWGYPSLDTQARALAQGEATRFSAWNLHARRDGELLMLDAHESTGSWFRAQALGDGGTQLCFGSVVFARRFAADGRPRFGLLFHLLLPLHRLYSGALLRAAARGLGRRG